MSKSEKKNLISGVVLTPEQRKNVNMHFKRILEAEKNLQNYLKEAGLEPVGGFPDIRDYSLVSGLRVIDSVSNDCTECSVVCFDNGCDCVECENKYAFVPEDFSILRAQSHFDFKSAIIKPEIVRPTLRSKKITPTKRVRFNVTVNRVK